MGTLTISDDTDPHGYGMIVDRDLALARFSVDGVVETAKDTDITTWVNSDMSMTDEMQVSNADFYSAALFVFPDGIPDDYPEALAWMSEQWALGRKLIWPAWENL